MHVEVRMFPRGLMALHAHLVTWVAPAAFVENLGV